MSRTPIRPLSLLLGGEEVQRGLNESNHNQTTLSADCSDCAKVWYINIQCVCVLGAGEGGGCSVL